MNSSNHRLGMFVDVQDVHVLVVGGGGVAARKVRRMIEAGARVTVIAPSAQSELQEMHGNAAITLLQKTFEPNDITGDGANDSSGKVSIVIAATDNIDVNAQVAQYAKQAGCYVNVADNPQAGNFILPSIVDRSPILIAVSSGGASPVLTRLITARLEAYIPHTYSELANLAGRYRDQIKGAFKDWRTRRRFWEQQLSGRVGEMILLGRSKEAQDALEEAIANPTTQVSDGEVYLVGAGPGDPDLLSFRALRLMQQADVVFYDRLVSDAILALLKKDAEKIYVGKRRAEHAMQQTTINQQLVEHAKKGKRVLRLKGGDPFIFGRGGEEIETLADEGVPFQVVPGITAAAGVASYAGIPLTHRDYSQACLFVTGHLKNNTIDLNWDALVQPQQTVVIYMGLVGLPVIVKQLIQHGMSASTPIALISKGTTQHQEVVAGTLEDIVDKVNSAEVKPPTLTIIGEVVKLHDKLAWFKPSPLNSEIK
jgi:uroporphyrin-III C-methyltransferase/precorrin-2 dehydrogenase/sirohydrochlorin ferrochelatase